jgi:hypothetical protein
MVKLTTLTTTSTPLPRHPIFKPFSTFESKSYIKKTAHKIWSALSTIELAAPIPDMENAFLQ